MSQFYSVTKRSPDGAQRDGFCTDWCEWACAIGHTAGILNRALLLPGVRYAPPRALQVAPIRLRPNARTRVGITIDERVGNQRCVRLNSKWPLVEEVRSLCIKSFGVSEPIKNAIEPLLARISQAFLFGSVVKGTDHHESDIDLMIIGDVSMDELMVALEPAQRQLGRHIQFNLYSRNEWEKLASDRVVQSIVNGPKWIIYEQA